MKTFTLTIAVLFVSMANAATNSVVKTNLADTAANIRIDPVAAIDAQIERLTAAQEGTWKEIHELEARMAAARRIGTDVTRAEAYWKTLHDRAYAQGEKVSALHLQRLALDPRTSVKELESDHQTRIHKAIIGSAKKTKAK